MTHLMDGCTADGCAGEHVELVGGPLDGHLVPVDGWSRGQRTIGVAHIVPGEVYRACYAPPDGDPMADRWPFEYTIG